jgi:hypothetical protein
MIARTRRSLGKTPAGKNGQQNKPEQFSHIIWLIPTNISPQPEKMAAFLIFFPSHPFTRAPVNTN